MDVLVSPVILFFLLGVLAAAFRSDLAIPETLAKGMSIYLMAAIGLKGGVQVAEAGASRELFAAAAAGIALSCLIPLPVFAALRSLGGVDQLNAGAIAAHYGSVSVVTFAAGSDMLAAAGFPPAGFMVAVLALMETPAIVVGLLLAKGDRAFAGQSRGELVRETMFNGPVVLLIGSFVIGLIAGKSGVQSLSPFFENGFRGVLCLFLLDMGLIAVRRLRDTRALNLRLALLSLCFPVINGIIGVLAGKVIGLDTASAAMLGVLAASASYIAVPAAMRLALPQADAGLSLAMSLAVTFPFNIIAGIPLYSMLAQILVAR